MLKSKTKKFSKMRGSSSHGGGFKKKRRGSGNRGGFGRAGTGRGADSKHQRFSKEFGKNYFGKKGFSSVNKKSNKIINLGWLEINLDNLVEKKLVPKDGDKYLVDVKKLGFDKILGNGNLTKKVEVKNCLVSSSAKLKIEKSKGSVILKEKPE